MLTSSSYQDHLPSTLIELRPVTPDPDQSRAGTAARCIPLRRCTMHNGPSSNPSGNTGGRGGRPIKHCRTLVLDAIFYVVWGIAWRPIPAEFPPATMGTRSSSAGSAREYGGGSTTHYVIATVCEAAAMRSRRRRSSLPIGAGFRRRARVEAWIRCGETERAQTPHRSGLERAVSPMRALGSWVAPVHRSVAMPSDRAQSRVSVSMALSSS